MKNSVTWILIAMVLAFVAGIATGTHWKMRTATATKAAEVKQPDGSTMLRRDPALDTTPARHEIPQEAKEIQRIELHVQPNRGVIVHDTIRIAGTDSIETTDSCGCPAIAVHLSVIDEKNTGRRVIASAENGRILDGIDIPMAPIQASEATGRRWEPFLMVAVDEAAIRPGIGIQASLGRWQVGGGIAVETNLHRPLGIGLVGFRF